ncbi:hypothetical protein FQA47_017544 [Oryzias melastigma]|uniref:Uncharacterized protein n=1 Tax=Oryzias melastigma TaxID=30732 RepID=A0A834FM60_ORYME|nr:hypothetical protein FQA47_017544 [Oryzias melastigma]
MQTADGEKDESVRRRPAPGQCSVESAHVYIHVNIRTEQSQFPSAVPPLCLLRGPRRPDNRCDSYSNGALRSGRPSPPFDPRPSQRRPLQPILQLIMHRLTERGQEVFTCLPTIPTMVADVGAFLTDMDE